MRYRLTAIDSIQALFHRQEPPNPDRLLQPQAAGRAVELARLIADVNVGRSILPVAPTS